MAKKRKPKKRKPARRRLKKNKTAKKPAKRRVRKTRKTKKKTTRVFSHKHKKNAPAKKRRKQPRRNRAHANSVSKKPSYVLNTDFSSFYELRDLILKSLPAEKDQMTERINKLGRIKLAVISGVFLNKDNTDPLLVDLLIVGDDIDSRKLRSFLKALEAEVGKEIRFAVMDKEEFQYRLAMFDRFVRVLLEEAHEKLINRLGL